MDTVTNIFDNVLLNKLVLQNMHNQHINTMIQLSVSEYATMFGFSTFCSFQNEIISGEQTTDKQ